MGSGTRRAQDSRERAQPGTDRYQRSRERPCGSERVFPICHSAQGVWTSGRDRDDSFVSRLRRFQLRKQQPDPGWWRARADLIIEEGSDRYARSPTEADALRIPLGLPLLRFGTSPYPWMNAV